MKRIISFVLLCALAFSLIACDSDSTERKKNNGPSQYTPDYYDAESFESALNNGTKVNGKIVQFYVSDYKPNSALGINCWAGEHLNFISEDELDIEKGDYVIGRVTSEPTQTLGGSWKVPYEVLEIRDEAIEKKTNTETEKPDEEAKPQEKPNEDPKPQETPEPENTAIVMTTDAVAYVGKNPQAVEKELKNLGFEKVKLVQSVTTDTSKTDGSVSSVTAGSAVFKKGDSFEKDVEIIITYLKVEQPKPEIVLPQEGSKLAKDFDSNGESTVYYINVDGQKNKPTLTSWKDAIVTDGVLEYIKYLEESGFAVIVESISYKQPYSGFYSLETDFKVSKGDFYWTMYLGIQSEAYVEYELDINTEIMQDDPISMTIEEMVNSGAAWTSEGGIHNPYDRFYFDCEKMLFTDIFESPSLSATYEYNMEILDERTIRIEGFGKWYEVPALLTVVNETKLQLKFLDDQYNSGDYFLNKESQ